MPLIKLEGIIRSYTVGNAELDVLKNISLEIDEGEFIAIMGPSGSGKSTLMHILGLLDRPSSGTYELMGHDVLHLSEDQCAALRSRTIGFIFQMYNLLPRTSSLDNVILPMLYAGTSHRQIRARELLKEVAMESRVLHTPNQLSGGQQQRVAVARALVNYPKILFADEPTGNLDTSQSEEILQRLRFLNERGITIIMVTHEPDIAAHAKRIIHIKDGRIISDDCKRSDSEEASALPKGQTAVTDHLPLNVKPPELSWAEFKEYSASALRAMVANKIRSGLSMLGILIGVAAVIAMLAIGNGAQQSVESRLASLGSNVVMVFAGAPSMRGVRGAAGSYSRLTLEDAKAIQMLSPRITDIYPEAEGNVQIVYKNQNVNTELQGVTTNYESIRHASPTYGRFFTENENASLARVILLGPSVVSLLFGQEDPVGKSVKVNHINFNVIGLLPTKGSFDQDDMVVIPIRTAMRIVLGTEYLHEMAIECTDAQSISPAIEEIGNLLRHRHRLPAYKEDDFTIRNNADVQATLVDTTNTFSTLLGFVAAISLVVGGIGIMNIMLVAVTERTREIGLRKAVGATRRAILIQFLIESSLLSVIGGCIGILLGVVSSLIISVIIGWTVVITFQTILLSFVFSAGIGILFGFWPARKASLLSPMEALRYE
ncbi:MAG: ABC transporter permease [Endomicrobiales bacterium]|jgi:macrolide transport system ATP-binding/permease protein